MMVLKTGKKISPVHCGMSSILISVESAMETSGIGHMGLTLAILSLTSHR